MYYFFPAFSEKSEVAFTISYGMYRSLMDSPTVSLFNPKKSVVYQDMNQSLSHYYMVRICAFVHLI